MIPCPLRSSTLADFHLKVIVWYDTYCMPEVLVCWALVCGPMDACFVYPTPLYMLFLALHTLTMLLNATLFALWTG